MSHMDFCFIKIAPVAKQIATVAMWIAEIVILL